MQDCKVAARIRANTSDVTAEVKRTVASAKFVTVKSGPSVTKPVTVTVDSLERVTDVMWATSTSIPFVFEHLNVYPDSATLGWDQIKQPKPAAERMREMRARKAKSI